MTDSVYDNPSHWKTMHVKYAGSLKAVGRSGLSETYNKWKYRSEEIVFSKALTYVIFKGRKSEEKFRVLDIGAGSGYWMNVVKAHEAGSGIKIEFTAMDLSEKALDVLKQHITDATCMIQNAGTVDSMILHDRFELVMANYCLHHITQKDQFLNALQLAINSVKPGGYLLLMDCLIDRKYSPYYDVDTQTYTGSGLSRPLKLVDQMCEEKNMRRIYMADPISFLMNNVLEADTRFDYRIFQFFWKVLHRLYKSESISKWLMPIIFRADRFLTSGNKGYSTRLVIYQKQNG